MFVLCPHCQFLVAVDAASGQPPRRCPRCRKLLQPQPATTPEPDAGITDEPTAAALATATAAVTAQPDTVEPQQIASHAVEPLPVEPLADEAQVVEPEAIELDLADDAAGAVATDDIATPDDGAPGNAAPDATSPATIPAPAVAEPRPSRKRTRTVGVNDKPRAKPRASRSKKTAPLAATPAAAMPATSTSAPGFVQRQRVRIARSSHTQRWMIAAIALLSLLLALQLLLADRATLARDARWRPAMMALCSALRCSLPAWHEPAAFTLLDRDVRPRPGTPGVLHVTATFRNDARWPQPWPALLLTLSDLDGRAAGARVFTPREYLGAVPTQTMLASGQSAMLSMDVLEPGPRIVAFTFDFR